MNFVFIFNRRFFLLVSLLLLTLFAMILFGSPVSLDTKIYYTGDQARTLIRNMSSSQVNSYWINELIDLFLFIPIYTSTLFVGLRQIYPQNKKMWLLAFTPTVFDVLETSLILYALDTQAPQLFFNWLGLVTFFKWLLALGAVLALLRGIARRFHSTHQIKKGNA